MRQLIIFDEIRTDGRELHSLTKRLTDKQTNQVNFSIAIFGFV